MKDVVRLVGKKLSAQMKLIIIKEELYDGGQQLHIGSVLTTCYREKRRNEMKFNFWQGGSMISKLLCFFGFHDREYWQKRDGPVFITCKRKECKLDERM